MKFGGAGMIDIDKPWSRVQNGQDLGLSVGGIISDVEDPEGYLLTSYTQKLLARINSSRALSGKGPPSYMGGIGPKKTTHRQDHGSLMSGFS